MKRCLGFGGDAVSVSCGIRDKLLNLSESVFLIFKIRILTLTAEVCWDEKRKKEPKKEYEKKQQHRRMSGAEGG